MLGKDHQDTKLGFLRVHDAFSIDYNVLSLVFFRCDQVYCYITRL